MGTQSAVEMPIQVRGRRVKRASTPSRRDGGTADESAGTTAEAEGEEEEAETAEAEGEEEEEGDAEAEGEENEDGAEERRSSVISRM